MELPCFGSKSIGALEGHYEIYKNWSQSECSAVRRLTLQCKVLGCTASDVSTEQAYHIPANKNFSIIKNTVSHTIHFFGRKYVKKTR